MKTLILTPSSKINCGMYQLAKDLAKEFDGEIRTKFDKDYFWDDIGLVTDEEEYGQVISLLYPMHIYAKRIKQLYPDTTWICYDQKIPPTTKLYFPNFWRRQAMKYINWRNNTTKQGADESWDVTEREQKPRWTEKHIFQEGLQHCIYQNIDITKPYAVYLGRTTDYKNFDWIKKTMEELNIPLLHPENATDDDIWQFLSHAKMLVTASIWEGYGRPVMEAQALKIYTICFNTGAHDRLVKYGAVVPNHNFELFKQKVKEFWFDGIEDRCKDE